MLINLIFDFDGVIADSEEVFNQAIYFSLKKAGFDYCEKDVRENAKLQYFETIELMVKGKSELVNKYLIDFLVKRAKTDKYLYKDAKGNVVSLARKHKLFVVSNSPQQVLDECVAHHDLPFVSVLGRGKKLKSKRKALEYLLNKYQMKKRETAYIGDSLGDIDLAKLLGVTSIAVASGWNTKSELAKSNPDILFNNLGELAIDLTEGEDVK